MLNHITIRVSNINKSKFFYQQTLGALGYKLLTDNSNRYDEPSIGFGIEETEGKRDFWIKEAKLTEDFNSISCLAFTASSKEQVNNFYKAGIKAGGIDNGKPGYREKYHPGYYAAFVLDPDGYNIEAVFDNLNL